MGFFKGSTKDFTNTRQNFQITSPNKRSSVHISQMHIHIHIHIHIYIHTHTHIYAPYTYTLQFYNVNVYLKMVNHNYYTYNDETHKGHLYLRRPNREVVLNNEGEEIMHFVCSISWNMFHYNLLTN